MHPPPFVTVTVKVPAELTEIVCVVAPVDQLYPAYTPAFNVVELPEQNDKLPLMVGAAIELVFVVTDDEPVHPFSFVTVTVNVPAVFTEIVCVVSLVDHK